jgi:hypothetical protein
MPGVVFKPNRQKIIEAIVYLATQRPRIDVFHMCKVLFYADRQHLRKYGRPILGDTYCAMDDGPVPSFALNVAKRIDMYVSDDLLEIAKQKLSIDNSDGYIRLIARTTFNDESFSRTDIECLNEAIDKYADMAFMVLWRLVHREPEYKSFYRGSGTSTRIPYEALIPKDMPDRDLVIEQLREHAPATEL